MSDDTTHDAPSPITILGKEVTLRAPNSAAERWDFASTEVGGTRLLAAALGLCWPYLRGKLQKDGVRYRGEVATWGGQVFDWLLGKGVTVDEIVTAGKAALPVLTTDLPGVGLPKTDGETRDLLGN